MKNLSIKEMEKMMCSTGYLPPRNEDELLFFNQMYADYKSRIEDRHIDINSIFDGTCRVISSSVYDLELLDKSSQMVADVSDNNYSMAARNYDKLPKEILEKMKTQHKPKEDNDD